ncbi:hypothetical protein KBI23_20790 [bacterium]|nr:hypothetical protein [bacterium]
MREHQIVVNLKAQQFEQLQKLARERGFKSVSAYVKQKVLELAMGIDSEGGSYGQPTDEQVSLAAAPVLGDLDRIHNELKSFLDELSGPTELPNSALGASSSASAGNFAERKDFAVAAPDDDFDWAPTGGSGFSTAAYTNSIGASTTSGLGSGPSTASVVGSAASSLDIGTGASDFQEASDTSTLPQMLPSSNLGGFGYGLGKYSSFSGAGSGVGSSARFSTPFNAGDRLSGYRDIMDDMEELADRAFAISPRLGALDESVEDEPAEASRGRRKQVESANESAELDEQGAAELEASAYEESAEDYDSGYDYAEQELNPELDVDQKLELELGAGPGAGGLPSFVEPIALDKLLTPEQLEAEDVQDKLNAKEAKKAQGEAQIGADLAGAAVTDFSPEAAGEKSDLVSAAPQDKPEEKSEEKPRARRRSNKLFDEPMLPPPEEIDQAVERKPTFVPPPAPLPPRVSQTNIPAMTAEEAAAMEKSAALAAAAAIEDDLLSELLDGNLTQQRDESAPNPFAVSLSFELEATAVATNDVAGPVGMLADQLASLEEQTPLGQMAMAAEAALHEAPNGAEDSAAGNGASVGQAATTSSSASSSGAASNSGSLGSADATSTDSGEESLNPSTFSGTPPPKRRRT